MAWWRRTRPADANRDSDATDVLVAAIQAQAAGTLADAATMAATETCAGLWARALSAAEVEGTDAITPAVLALAGRELVKRGEVVYAIEGGRLLPASSFEVSGNADPATWRYRIQLTGPSGRSEASTRAANGVVHLRWAVDADAPWRGVGPLTGGFTTAQLAARAESGLANEAGSPHGYVVPVPVKIPNDDGDAHRGYYDKMLAGLKGRVAVVESTNTTKGRAWSGESGGSEWEAKRIGPNPPAGYTQLRQDALADVVAACGVPLPLARAGEGSAAREAWRRFLVASVQPLAGQLAREFSAKLGGTVSLSFRGLAATDLQVRSRAFAQFVNGGMTVDEAKSLALLD